MRLKTSSAKWRPYCLRLNVLTRSSLGIIADLKKTRLAPYGPICMFVQAMCY